LVFSIPLQHKYSYIRDKRSGVESYQYPMKEPRKARYIKLDRPWPPFCWSATQKRKGIERLI